MGATDLRKLILSWSAGQEDWRYIACQRPDQEPPTDTIFIPRLFRHVPGLKYTGMGDQQRICDAGDYAWVDRSDPADEKYFLRDDRIKIIHARHMRSGARLKNEGDYVRHQAKVYF